jgi:hypothetical protein
MRRKRDSQLSRILTRRNPGALSGPRRALSAAHDRRAGQISVGGLRVSCPLGHRDCLQPQSRRFPASSFPMRKAPPRLPAKIQSTTPRLLLPLPRGRAVDDPANGGGVSVLGHDGAYPSASLIQDKVLFLVETGATRQGLPCAKGERAGYPSRYMIRYTSVGEMRFGHRSIRAAVLAHRGSGWTESDHCILHCSRTQ